MAITTVINYNEAEDKMSMEFKQLVEKCRRQAFQRMYKSIAKPRFYLWSCFLGVLTAYGMQKLFGFEPHKINLIKWIYVIAAFGLAYFTRAAKKRVTARFEVESAAPSGDAQLTFDVLFLYIVYCVYFFGFGLVPSYFLIAIFLR